MSIVMITGCGGGGGIELTATQSDAVRINQIKLNSFIGSTAATLE